MGAMAPRLGERARQIAAAAGHRRLSDAAKRSSSFSASGSASPCCSSRSPRRRFSAGRVSHSPLPCCAVGVRAAQHGRWRGWPRRRQHRLRLSAARRARPARRQRRSRARSRPGAAAGVRRARLRAPGPVRRAAADQSRAPGRHRRAADALHNLANRTELDDIQSLVTMLVQTDKFGTSVAQSLRVHSEYAAHEAASARGRSGRQDRREDGVPAGHLHLPRNLGRHARSGGHQVHPGSLADGAAVMTTPTIKTRRSTIPNPAAAPAGADDARGQPGCRADLVEQLLIKTLYAGEATGVVVADRMRLPLGCWNRSSSSAAPSGWSRSAARPERLRVRPAIGTR